MSTDLKQVYRDECAKARCKCNTGVLKSLPADDPLMLTKIDLSLNVVGKMGVHPIFVVASLAPNLTHLILPDNYLANENVTDMVGSLAKHNNLSVIDLSNNPISHVAGKKISTFVAEKTSIVEFKLDGTLINPALIAIIRKKCEANKANLGGSIGPTEADATPAASAITATAPAATLPHTDSAGGRGSLKSLEYMRGFCRELDATDRSDIFCVKLFFHVALGDELPTKESAPWSAPEHHFAEPTIIQHPKEDQTPMMHLLRDHCTAYNIDPKLLGVLFDGTLPAPKTSDWEATVDPSLPSLQLALRCIDGESNLQSLLRAAGVEEGDTAASSGPRGAKLALPAIGAAQPASGPQCPYLALIADMLGDDASDALLKTLDVGEEPGRGGTEVPALVECSEGYNCLFAVYSLLEEEGVDQSKGFSLVCSAADVQTAEHEAGSFSPRTRPEAADEVLPPRDRDETMVMEDVPATATAVAKGELDPFRALQVESMDLIKVLKQYVDDDPKPTPLNIKAFFQSAEPLLAPKTGTPNAEEQPFSSVTPPFAPFCPDSEAPAMEPIEPDTSSLPALGTLFTSDANGPALVGLNILYHCAFQLPSTPRDTAQSTETPAGTAAVAAETQPAPVPTAEEAVEEDNEEQPTESMPALNTLMKATAQSKDLPSLHVLFDAGRSMDAAAAKK